MVEISSKNETLVECAPTPWGGPGHGSVGPCTLPGGWGWGGMHAPARGRMRALTGNAA